MWQSNLIFLHPISKTFRALWKNKSHNNKTPINRKSSKSKKKMYKFTHVSLFACINRKFLFCCFSSKHKELKFRSFTFQIYLLSVYRSFQVEIFSGISICRGLGHVSREFNKLNFNLKLVLQIFKT